ncbi:hypothetical protein [Clostridium cadaveris]|uniref:hypothetical protein n=1 Tax=Clostridium cadaveris TaxID=1529 RepID=UPI003991E028
MDKEIVIVTKDNFKFIFKGEEAESIMSNIWHDDEVGLIHFGDKNLVIPLDNISYYWCR